MIEIEYPIYIDIADCPRCGHFHDHLEAAEINPPEVIEGEEYRWWALCPLTNEPIFIRDNDE